VAHSAGSVKFLLDDALLSRGIKVSTAGAAMITPVAEMTLLLCLLMLRPVYKLDAGLRAGQSWAEMKLAGVGDELSAQTVGVVGVGQIGRRVIELLRAFEARVLAYDPFLDDAVARQLGVTRCATLAELMPACRIVSLHAPILPETRHMIGRAELAAMRDGAVLVNTARAWLVDTAALADELRAGRLRCATDVFDNEPLPVEDAWRALPNTLILPHIAASTPQCFFRQGDITVDEVGRFLANQPLRYEVTPELYATMA
jgi:phosphoglycerate dehydrogenase-like enzyme